MKKLIAFDLDDTLYKEIEFVESAFNYISTRIGKSYPELETTEKLSAKMMDIFLSKGDALSYARQATRDTVEISVLLDWYRYHTPELSLSPSIKNLLTQLHSHGYVLGIITDGRSISQRNKIKALGLNQFINNDNIIISDEIGTSKPSEANYTYLTNKYPDFSEFTYVGDNITKDFVTPNRLGWKTIGIIDDGRNIHPQLMNQPTEFLPDLWIKPGNELKILDIL